MSEFINTIDQLGDEVVLARIIDGSLIEFKDDKITTLTRYCFRYHSSLITIDLPKLTSIEYGAWYECSNLTTLILRSSSLCSLSNTMVFYLTPIAKGSGYIYVPRALLSDDDSTKDYRKATNWTTYANQFRALEDYTIDGTTTGELDPSKI